jgi:bifunctional pyridoxal-dependent enzyme with beta-cystathionase and maltose regulon repressor activities
MFAEIIDGLLKYIEQEDTQTMLEQKILDPVLSWLSRRYRWCVSALQAVLALALIQTILLVVILCVVLRSNVTQSAS